MFHIHRAERADGLVDALGAVVSSPLDDPMQAEVVAVPTRGVERWLTQRLSAVLGASPGRADGVCANVEFPFPGRLVNGAVAAAVGVDREADPWLPARSVWPLLDVVEASLDEPWLAPLAAHLGGAGAGADRFAARAPAEQRAAHRRSLRPLRRPPAGAAPRVGGRKRRRLAGRAVEAAARAHRRAEPGGAAGRRLRAAAGRAGSRRPAGAPVAVRADAPAGELPRRPATRLRSTRDVHLFLLHPSAELWARIAAFTRDLPPIVRRDEDATAALPQNPLLASWGQDAREMQLVLAGDRDDRRRPRPRRRRGAADRRCSAESRPTFAPIARRRACRSPAPPTMRVLLEPDDRSLQVHACHGRARQVEVVRDAILHLLDDDPTLEPRDIIVMCPDIEVFAPLHPRHVRNGSRRRRRGRRAAGRRGRGSTCTCASPTARCARPTRCSASSRKLLDLAGGRLTASQVLDLAGRDAGPPALPPRRRRPRRGSRSGRATAACAGASMRRSVPRTGSTDCRPTRGRRAGIACWSAWRWRRRDSGSSAVCCRSTTSAAATSTSPAASPSFFSACARSWTRSPNPMPLDAWAAAIADAADSLTAAPGRDAWQRVQLGRLLEEVVAEGTTAGAVTQTALALPEIRALLADRLRGRPTRASFRTGHLTICTLVPMRSVPHRVVCLIGLDDGVFPRQTARDGDDLLLLDPHVGDRDARSEDRQLLLDALLAATDHLVITYAGRDERTNLRRPPAVPLGELLDVVDRTARFPDAATARERVVVEHPLQPFDLRNFDRRRAGARANVELRPGRAATVRGHSRAARSTRRRSSPRRCRASEESLIELDELVRFVQHPVRAFLRQRLGVAGVARDDDVQDALSVELDALEQWQRRGAPARGPARGRRQRRRRSRPRSPAASCRRSCWPSRCSRASIRSSSSSSRRRQTTSRPPR